MFPRLPRVLRARKHGPVTLPAPLVGMPSSHVAISDVPILCSRCTFVAVLRVLASPSATPKCLSGTSTWGTAAATRSHDFPVRNSFPERNTPLISVHGALSSTPCWWLIEGFGLVCAVTSIVDHSVRSIESIDGRYGGCWRRSSPKPPSHKPRRRLNSSSTPGPVDCARAVWRETLSWVPFVGAAPPQVTRLSPPTSPSKPPRSSSPGTTELGQSPLTRAHCGGGGARSLARSRARCVAVAVEAAGGYIASHARYARRASRACMRTSSPRVARVITVFRSPRARPAARARCSGGGARSLARSRACGAAVVMVVWRSVQRTPRRRSAGVPPAVRRRSAGGPPAFRTRSAPVPHRCRTGAAPVPHRCRRRSAANPHGYLQTARKANKLGVFFRLFSSGDVFVDNRHTP